MKIANIIYEKELVNHVKLDYINYFNEPKAYDDLDKSLPTLYVGWTFMKTCNPDNSIIQNADILKNKIVTDELYWEFSFSENKASHVKGVNIFTGLVPQFYFKPKYSYTNLDPVFFMLKDINDLMDVVPKKIDYCYNYKNEIIYILTDNKIVGINLKMYEFFKFNINDILLRINDRTKSIITDMDGTYYQKYYKIFPNYEHLKRYIVTI